MSEIINNFKVFRDFPPDLTQNIKILYTSILNSDSTYGYCVLNDNKVFGLGIDIHYILGYEMSNAKYVLITELCQKNIQEFYQAFGYGCVLGFARNEKNEIFSWGHNKYGQLGRGFKSEECIFLRPDKIDFFDGKNITEISYGYRHCLALSSDGLIYGWGDNSGGNREDCIITTPRQIILTEKIKSIYSTFHDPYGISFEGNFYFWGNSTLFTKTDHPNKLGESVKIKSILNYSDMRQLYVLSYDGIIYKFLKNNYEMVFDLYDLSGDLQEKKINDLCVVFDSVIFQIEDCVYNFQKSSYVKTSYKTLFEYLFFEFKITFKTIHIKEKKLFVLDFKESCDDSEPLIKTFKEIYSNVNNFNQKDTSSTLTKFRISKDLPQILESDVKYYYQSGVILNWVMEQTEYYYSNFYVMNDNKVYSLGYDQNGKLGMGHNEHLEKPPKFYQFSKYFKN